jgi:outer membrane lipoprotein LolB
MSRHLCSGRLASGYPRYVFQQTGRSLSKVLLGSFRSLRLPGLRLLGMLGLTLAMGGCAILGIESTPPLPEASSVKQQEITSFDVVGRVGVHHDNEGFSGNIDWRHQAQRDEILITSPLGQGVAQIIRADNMVRLVTSEGETHVAPDAETLTEQVLGWRLPLSGLRWWVLGRVEPGKQAKTRLRDDGWLDSLDQDGWHIDFLDYQQVEKAFLPSRIFLTRGNLEVKLIVGQWHITP